ncbi:beta-N-acetylhexosaminidase [Streptomyces sp. NPDC090022]|uniref:beta-N-acetylhexosaminidase n=1 Tax=Streptomyces sp. NPDC090022 TaxID=3365920 RepID=UPI0037FE8A50
MDLIPAPVHVAVGPGHLELLDPALAVGPGTERVARWLRRELGAATGWELPTARPDGVRDGGAGGVRDGGAGGVRDGGAGGVRDGGAGGVRDGVRDGRAEGVRDGVPDVVRLRVDAGLAPEAYRLTVGADGVALAGGSAAGVFWAAQTLRQLLGPRAYRRAPLRPGRPWRLPHTAIEDAPRFAWRGLMLDVARHFLPKDGVLRYLDLLAAHKLNVLHLHLTDDQGWRVEIKRYPRLTGVGAWRPRSRRGHGSSRLWDDTPHGGFYTQDDLREIAAYAAERHIRVVPEIDVPGHAQAAIAAYPELGNTDVVDTAALGVWDRWGISENVLAPTEAVLRFYEGVFEELLELFPAEVSPFVHIGGDECPKTQWRASAVAQGRIRELGLAGEDELQAWFVRHFDTWLAARGRRLIGWDEILEGGLAPGAAVSSWRGYAGGVAAAEAGHDVVMCPEQQVYLDHRQDGGTDEPVPIGYVRTLEDVYRFEPVPPELSPAAAAHVLGGQANVWTEVMENQNRVDYQAFPRLTAFAEVMWSALPAPAERDWAGFAARMAAHYARLDALGVDYRPPGGPRPWQRRPGVPGRPREGAPPRA